MSLKAQIKPYLYYPAFRAGRLIRCDLIDVFGKHNLNKQKGKGIDVFGTQNLGKHKGLRNIDNKKEKMDKNAK